MDTFKNRYLICIPLILVVAYFECSVAHTAGCAGITPIDEVQSRLVEFAEVAHGGSATPESFERIERLETEILDLLDNDKIELLRQWICCYYTSIVPAKIADFGMSMLGVLGRFDVRPEEYVYAFYPLLETTDTEFLSHVKTYIVFGDWAPDRRIDFGVHLTILKEKLSQGEDLPHGLVSYMFERSPGTALIEFMALDEEAFSSIRTELKVPEQKSKWPLGYKKRLVLSEEHSVATITAALDQLSNREEWWIKLFVAEFIRQVPDVSTPALRTRLGDSDHPLVKKALEPYPENPWLLPIRPKANA